MKSRADGPQCLLQEQTKAVYNSEGPNKDEMLMASNAYQMTLGRGNV